MTETMTSPDVLPQHNGRPVPWVARWSNEHSGQPAKVSRHDGKLTVEYEDGNNNYDDLGILWIREGITRSGEPQYAQVNTYRQRSAMAKCRCQVCGKKIDERPIRWLVPNVLLQRDHEGNIITASAPTCSPCIPLSLSLCPHLKKEDYSILRVLAYEAWGVQGDFLVNDEESNRLKQLKSQKVPYSHPELFPNVVARQLVVTLTKYVVEEGLSA